MAFKWCSQPEKLAGYITLALLLSSFQSTAQENLDPVNAAPGARTWRWSDAGISVRLTQIVPDQLRGFFQARGFKPAEADLIANACVFQTVIRNETSASIVDVDLGKWKVISGNQERGLRVREVWEPIWLQRQVSNPARLGFRWALFPTTQVFHHGDWNMGMTSAGLPGGAKFDLDISVLLDKKAITGRIKDIECAGETK